MENYCDFSDSLAVRVSTVSGFWPREDMFTEAKLDTPVTDILKEAAKKLNLASTADFVARY